MLQFHLIWNILVSVSHPQLFFLCVFIEQKVCSQSSSIRLRRWARLKRGEECWLVMGMENVMGWGWPKQQSTIIIIIIGLSEKHSLVGDGDIDEEAKFTPFACKWHFCISNYTSISTWPRAFKVAFIFSSSNRGVTFTGCHYYLHCTALALVLTLHSTSTRRRCIQRFP